MPTFSLLVELPVAPGRMEQVRELMSTLLPRARGEEGCLVFDIYFAADNDAAWIREEFVSEQYHDDVHESFPEVKNVLARLPEYLSGPWTVHRLAAGLSL